MFPSMSNVVYLNGKSSENNKVNHFVGLILLGPEHYYILLVDWFCCSIVLLFTVRKFKHYHQPLPKNLGEHGRKCALWLKLDLRGLHQSACLCTVNLELHKNTD